MNRDQLATVVQHATYNEFEFQDASPFVFASDSNDLREF